jgi:hypothetical protein
MKLKFTDLLKGKKVNVMTDAKVIVVLEIKSVEEKHHSVNLEPATPQNDWWPPSREWSTLEVEFTNGYIKRYDNLSQIDFYN